MSSPHNGRNMDRPTYPGGSVKNARERAAAGLPREDFSSLPSTDAPSAIVELQITHPSISRRSLVAPSLGQIRPPRPLAPPGLQTKDGQMGVAISRPAQIPHWPLQGSLAASAGTGAEPYRPPYGSQPPQRPPRPSRVPSLLDGSKVQDHTPVFQYRPQVIRDSSGQELSSVAETPNSQSRPSTLSSVASIPDFPLPIQAPPLAVPPRRSANLGPPPSARRGASSFYSNASYVSPIPEESPRSRSHTSFASSAAMPERWDNDSPGVSPDYPDAFYDDMFAEEGMPSPNASDNGEENRLVRSASIGKRAKPILVSASTPRTVDPEESMRRPGLPPAILLPSQEATAFYEASSSSSGTPPTFEVPAAARPVFPTQDSFLSSNTASDTSFALDDTPTPPVPVARSYNRFSAIRRPPKLDIDAVRKNESRGSLTSLPDLIRRATRLAASLDRGRRPASRLDDLNDLADLSFGPAKRGIDRDVSYDAEKHQSGLSDMLAAFPPPAQAQSFPRRSFRDSLRQQVASWPLPLNRNSDENTHRNGHQISLPGDVAEEKKQTKGRRCCGLPLWGFILVLVLVIALVAAAVIIPLEFFVIRKQNINEAAQGALDQCQQQIKCQNGGTNILNQGFCSCICTGGFTGFDCTVPPGIGCTTTTLPGDGNLNNVTLGDAIPRLIQQAQANFSVPLFATNILAKLSSGNLSCSSENALVTFDGSPTRQGEGNARVTDAKFYGAGANGALVERVTVVAMPLSTFTVKGNHAGPPLATSPLTRPNSGQSIALDSGTGFKSPPSIHTLSVTHILPTTTTTITITVTPPNLGPTSIPRSIQQSLPPTSVPTSHPDPPTAPIATPPSSTPSPVFVVTEEVLDFARVAILYILQQETIGDAETAQVSLQRFFTLASSSLGYTGVSITSAQNVSMGSDNTINLVNLSIDSGSSSNGTVGRTHTDATGMASPNAVRRNTGSVQIRVPLNLRRLK